MAYQEEFFDTNIVKLRRMFPLLHLWRIPGIAFERRKILVCYICLMLIVMICGFLPFNGQGYTPFDNRSTDLSSFSLQIIPVIHCNIFTTWCLGFYPGEIGRSYNPFLQLFLTILTIPIWLACGLVVTRLTACEFATGKPGKLSSTVVVFLKQYMSIASKYLILLPLIGFLFLMKLFLGYFESEFARLMLTPIYLVTSFFLLILIWMLACLSMMICTSTVDGADAFDGVSRTFGYVVNRFGYFFILILGAMLVSYVSLWLFSLVIAVMIIILETLYHTYPQSIDYNWLYSWEQLTRIHGQLLTPINLNGFQIAALMPHHENHNMVYKFLQTIVFSAGASLFWTSSTVIYFLLRNAEDGTPLHEIYEPKLKQPETGVPLVGIAERERAMKHVATSAPHNQQDPSADTPS